MTQVSPPRRSRPPAAGVLGCVAFLLLGWASLLVPTLIRQVRDAFGQSDAGIGVFYFVYAVAYAVGSFAGGIATERLGRRVVLSVGAASLGLGIVALGLAPGWVLFLAAAVPMGVGAGTIDGGVNGLFLDLFAAGRGRALNAVHLFFSLGALGAPLVIGWLVVAGVAWQSVLVVTGVVGLAVALLFGTIPMPAGRRVRRDGADDAGGPRARPSALLVLLGASIAFYVASEVGVSSWLVRFLEPAPLTTATAGLALFWAGLTLGRLASARYSDRFDHLAFAIVAVAVMSATLLAAILVPSLELSIALFAVSGFASGPIFPMIVAIGGDRFPDRPAAVGGYLTGLAVAGSVAYPPLMGFMSVSVGITAAMLGNVVLGVACLVALVAVGGTRPTVSAEPAAPG